MNIRHRITILIALTFLAIAAIGGYAVLRSQHSAAEVKTVTEGVVPSALATADLVSRLKDVQLTTMAIIASPDGQLAAQANEKLTPQKNALREALKWQSQHTGSDTQRGLVEQARESLDNYFSAIDEAVGNKLAGRADIAQAGYFGNVVQYQDELEVIVGTLRIEKNRSKDSAISALNENLATTTTAIAIAAAFAVLFLTLAGALLYRQITGPISRMQTMMSEIAASQDFTRRVPVGRHDEIGRSILAFNGMIEKIEENAALLKQKSADIQTMLQNIPQGILTVVQGNTIHPEYSAYLETVLGTADIAGRDLMDLLFADSSAGADTLAQVAVATAACIGEDRMNFEFNEHLLIGEIEKTTADGQRKILDLSWSPIVDDRDTTVRLMLCVRDVTELRALAAEANEQKRELEMIGEILALSPEQFNEFITGSRNFIDENEQIIARHPEASAFALARLFRNMHTVKGNSRTYGLLQLANAVHEAEQSYDALRQPGTAAEWNPAQLQSELGAVRVVLERYAAVNEVKLGRAASGGSAVEAAYSASDKKRIQDSLHRLEAVNTANLHELVAVRNAVRKTLRLLGTERLEETLAGVLASLPALAGELGKAPPQVEIDDSGYAIHVQAGAMLKNVFMHLIRNALDHGIESPDARAICGKPASGTIALTVAVAGDSMQIALQDDGRGLALARIRQLARERGLHGDPSQLSDEQAAALIFSPGFSTAERVSDVSGRGVGMDAVREFVMLERGSIAIVLTDDAAGADFRPFKLVVSLPRQLAVPIDGEPADAATVATAATTATIATTAAAPQAAAPAGAGDVAAASAAA